jgi:hypothetical protein
LSASEGRPGDSAKVDRLSQEEKQASARQRTLERELEWVAAPVEAGEHEIVLGGEARRYHLRRFARHTLAITIEPGGTLTVTAPHAATLAHVEAVLRRRREWISRRTRDTAALRPDQFRGSG